MIIKSETFKATILCFWYTCNVQCILSPKDPDETRTIPELIESRGFECETHYITTADGYILTTHRIINPQSTVTDKRTVILQHGLFGSGYEFLTNSAGLGTENSDTYYEGKIVSNTLSFALAMFDYDVWIPNTRGNIYGRNHTYLSPDDKRFWQFSLDEMIKYDLPAVIDYIQRCTKQSTLAYVGHSQGSTTMFGLLSEKPEYSKIIKPFIAIAPVAKVAHIKTPLVFLAKNPFLLNLFYHKGGQFFPPFDLLNSLIRTFCKVEMTAKLICSNLLFLFAGGFNSKQFDYTRLRVIFSHLPSSTSSWNVVHFAQMVISNRFTKFDYGEIDNWRRYGSLSPPEYDLKKIDSNSIAMLHSTNDWLAPPEDVNFLRQQLAGKLIRDYKIPDDSWNHVDYFWAKTTAKFVNVVILDILWKFKSVTSAVNYDSDENED